jgi:hypothetical protein
MTTLKTLRFVASGNPLQAASIEKKIQTKSNQEPCLNPVGAATHKVEPPCSRCGEDLLYSLMVAMEPLLRMNAGV